MADEMTMSAEMTEVLTKCAWHMGIYTINPRHENGWDDRTVNVWGVREALLAAYEAGRSSVIDELRAYANKDD